MHVKFSLFYIQLSFYNVQNLISKLSQIEDKYLLFLPALSGLRSGIRVGKQKLFDTLM